MLFGKKEENKNKDSGGSLDYLKKQVEAILFYRGEEISLNFLVKILAKKKKEIVSALDLLEKELNNSALTLIRNDEKILLTIKSDFSDIISQIKGEENLGELSPSALETLAIVLYKGPISKGEIDQIRGVNSSYILRNLLIRGLVERKNISGKNVYQETFDLMRYLGIQKKDDLPAFQKVVEKLDQIDRGEEKVFEKKEDKKNNKEENE